MNQQGNKMLGAINLKPSKPEVYERRRDFQVVSNWIFNIEHEKYLTLIQLILQTCLF